MKGSIEVEEESNKEEKLQIWKSVCSSAAGLRKQPRVEADCSSHPRFWGLSGKTSPLCVTLLLETMWIWEGYLKVVLNLKVVSLMFKKQERNFIHSKMNKWYKEDLTQQKTWCISLRGKKSFYGIFPLIFPYSIKPEISKTKCHVLLGLQNLFLRHIFLWWFCDLQSDLCKECPSWDVNMSASCN